MLLSRLISTAALFAASAVAVTATDIPDSLTNGMESRGVSESAEDTIKEYIKSLDLVPDDTAVLHRRQSTSSHAADNAAAAIHRRADAPTIADIPQNMTEDMALRSQSENIEDIVMEYIKKLNLLPKGTNILYRRESPSSSPASNGRHSALSALLQVRTELSQYLTAAKNHASGIVSRSTASIPPTSRLASLFRRDSPPPLTPTWNSSTIAACTNALSMLRGLANSPSGMSMCYNLPFLSNTTGVFEADLRLFTIGPATGAFAGIASKDIAIDVRFAGAQVQPVPTSELAPNPVVAKRGRIGLSWPPSRREVRALMGMEKRSNQAPVLAQSYAFVGQINKELLDANLN